MISFQASDIFFCIRYDYLQDQNSAGSLFKGLIDVLHIVCFPVCLLEICAKCVEGPHNYRTEFYESSFTH